MKNARDLSLSLTADKEECSMNAIHSIDILLIELLQRFPFQFEGCCDKFSFRSPKFLKYWPFRTQLTNQNSCLA